MNNSYINKNSNSLNNEKLNWNLIQIEMKNKLGLDIYESWLKKLSLLKNSIIIYFYLFQQDLLEIGLPLDIWIRYYKLSKTIKKKLFE